MVEDAEITNLRNIIYSQHVHDTLNTIKQISKKTLSTTDQLNLQLLESEVHLISGVYEKSYRLANHVFEKSQEIGESFSTIDALIAQAKAFRRMGKYIESFEAIKHAEKILEILDQKSIFFKDRIAQIVFQKSAILIRTGELKQAFQYAKQCHQLFVDAENVIGIAEAFDNLAFCRYFMGDFNESMKLYKEALLLNNKLNNKVSSAATHNRISMIYANIGDPKKVEDHLQKSLDLAQEIGFKKGIAEAFGSLGRLASNRGELNQALEHYQNSLQLYDDMGLKGSISRAWFLGGIGKIYHQKGDLTIASDYYKKSLDTYVVLKSKNQALFDALVNYVKLSVDVNKPEQVEPYIQYIKQQDVGKEKLIASIAGTFSLIQGLLLKSSMRLRDKARAQQLFQQVVEEEDMYYEFKVEALLNLCDLLFDELKMSGSDEVLTEIKTFAEQLYDIAEVNNSYYLLAETYLLESKLALIEIDLTRCQKFLDKASSLADEQGLIEVYQKVANEQLNVVEFKGKWGKFVDEKPSIIEMIELTKLDEQLNNMLFKKLGRRDEEIKEYVEKAKQLVKMLELES